MRDDAARALRIDDPDLEPIWAAADEADLPIMYHAFTIETVDVNLAGDAAVAFGAGAAVVGITALLAGLQLRDRALLRFGRRCVYAVLIAAAFCMFNRYVDGLGGRPQATVIGTDIVTSSVNAALANGMLAHADETDDSHNASRSHPGCAVVPAALAHDMVLLCYGSVAGGFLGDRWLGQPEPPHPLENRSLTKYKLIIDDFGGWDLFQALLRCLRGIADRHQTDIATVASAAMLDRPAVAAVIVGARNRSHLPQNLKIASLQLAYHSGGDGCHAVRHRP